MNQSKSPFRAEPEVSEELAAEIAEAEAALEAARSLSDLKKRDRALMEVKGVIKRLRRSAPYAITSLDAALCQALLELFRVHLMKQDLTTASLIIAGIPLVDVQDLARAELARAFISAGIYWGASKTIMFVKSPDLQAELEQELARLERPDSKRGNAPSAGDTCQVGSDGYRVMVIDNFNRHDPDDRFLVSGFARREEAEEYARRRVRASIESLRKPGMGIDELHQAWESMGEEVVADGQFMGAMHFTDFAKIPATHTERDYLSLQPDHGRGSVGRRGDH